MRLTNTVSSQSKCFLRILRILRENIIPREPHCVISNVYLEIIQTFFHTLSSNRRFPLTKRALIFLQKKSKT